MEKRLLTGVLCAGLGAAVPWLLMGMGQPDTAVQLEQELEQPEMVEIVTEQERCVTEIIVHEKAEEGIDEAVSLEVTIDGVPVTLSLEEYLVGVLMGEMPGEFPMEALKAQVVAARTFTLRRLEQGGVLSDDASLCQAYTPPESAEEKWGEGWETYLSRMKQAVSETDGQVLTYQGDLISATYFSCSGGKTESAQAVWGGDAPYLVSVASPGEEGATVYNSYVSVPLEEFLAVVGVENPSVSAVTYTEGGGVETITIDGKTLTGTEMRSLFGLKSTMFSVEITGEAVEFLVRGYGHRVGMSQYGAKAMAEQGASYEEILKWYYTGVEIDGEMAREFVGE